MKIASTEQITFENPSLDGAVHWQDIVFNGEVIGALRERDFGIMQPPSEHYQRCAPESDASLFDGWYESEDVGFIFGYFFTLEKFIDY